MKNIIKEFWILAILLSVALSGYAYNFEVNGIYYGKNSDGKTVYVTYKTTSYNSYSGSVVIPSTVTYRGTTYSVTEIGGNAFRYCSGLTSVTIRNSVTSIGNYAFRDCGGLTSVTIPNSVTEIGADVFKDCSGLTSVVFNAENCTTMGSSVFYGCSKLTSLTIGETVKTIPDYAFYGCSGLTSVTIPNSVSSIGSSAFEDCYGLTSVTIGNSVTSIGWSAFENCSRLTSVTIPDSVTSIGNSAFRDCSGLKELTIQDGTSTLSIGSNNYYSPSSSLGEGLFYDAPLESVYLGRNLSYDTSKSCGYSPFNGNHTIKELTIGNSVTSIGSYAFEDCSGLTSVTIGNSVTSIGSSAFSGNSKLTSVTIPNSVTSIGENAFYNCSGLTSVTIGNSVTEIGADAFKDCSALTKVEISDIAAWCKIGFVLSDDGNTRSNPLVYAHLLYLNGKEVTNLVIPNSVTSIGSSVFYGCSGLTSVTIPNSVTSIGNYAFYKCSGLTSVTIPNSVTSIGGSAFYGCSGLTSVVFNAENCTTMGSYTYPVFYGCSNLTSLTIGENVKTIPDYAFYACSGLTSVTIPNSVTSIGGSAFYGCSGLKQLTIQDGTSTLSLGYNSSSSSSVGEGMFYDVPLDSIYLGRDLSYDTSKSCGYSPFYGNRTIKELTIGNSVTSIGGSAFRSCSGLTSVTIPNSVTSIGSAAFYNCSGLTKVEISDIVAWCKIRFGNYFANPLYYAHHLYLNGKEVTNLVIPNSVTSIGDDAFSGCSGLTSVTIPNSVTSIGSSAFEDCSGLTSVTIPNSVTSIGGYAFSYCSGMTLVTIPNSVTSIGDGAFNGCSGLKQLTIQDGTSTLSLGYNLKRSSSSSVGEGLFNDAPLESVYLGRNLSYDTSKSCGYSPFSGKRTIKELTIGNSVTSIGDYTFSGCSGLTSVTIPNLVTSIGNYAFLGCRGLTSVVFNAENCTSMGSSSYPVFYGCSNLTSLTIGANVKTIPSYAFQYCSGLKQLTIQDGTSTLLLGYNSSSSSGGKGLFYDAPLESVYLGRNLSYNTSSSYGYSPFYGKSTIKELTIGNSVTSIGDYAFEDCSSLKAVVFGSGLKEIGSNAFYNCSLAKTFWLPNTPPSGTSKVKSSVYYVANDQYSFSNQIKYQFLSSMFSVDGTVYVPVSPSERTCDVINCTYSPDYKSIVIKNKVINKGVELSVLKINPYSHIGNPFIENLSISYNGTIGHDAFQNCDALKSATVENCGSIGDYAFQNCDALNSATVKNCGSIGDYAFQNCDVLESATVENNGLIGNYAFSGCTSLKTVTLGSSVTGIGDKAFYNCSSLDKIIIPDAVTTVGTSAFEGCVSLENASIGKDVLSLSQSVFSGCRSLSSLTIPNNVESIGNYAFSGCTSLSDITIEDGEKKDSTSQQTPVWFADWTSTNHNSSSTSYQEYSFEAREGNSLSFDYSVSSESGYDYLIIKLNETQIVKESGNKSGSYNKEFMEAGTYTLYLSYTKDSSTNSGSDQASVTNICVSNGVPFSSLSLGSNGSSPLFNDCPLDEVYIGRKLSYTTNSSAGYSPFYRNTSLRRVRITDAETQIYDNEFYGCSNLQALTVGNGVTTIGKWAFSGCSAMKDFSVGSKVESIGQEAFSDCTGLTSFYSYSIVPPTCGNQALDDINKWECSLYVPDDCISAYQAADQWKEFFFIYGGEEEMSIEDKSAPNIVSGVLRCDGVFTDVYTLFGVKVYSGNGEVKLEGGVYIVVANGHATKVMVK